MLPLLLLLPRRLLLLMLRSQSGLIVGNLGSHVGIIVSVLLA